MHLDLSHQDSSESESSRTDKQPNDVKSLELDRNEDGRRPGGTKRSYSNSSSNISNQISSSTISRVKAKKRGLLDQDAGNDDTVEAVIRGQETLTFAKLGVAPWLVASLSTMAIKRPTGIQKGCIPEILKGRDCIGGSRTGSGKTVAFAVPILQKWAEDPVGIFAVILTPTRLVQSLQKFQI